MSTGNGNPAAHQDGLSETVWKTLYQEALFEVHPEILTEKIDAAQKAIAARALALLRGDGNERDTEQEKQILANAHGVLDDLKRIYQIKGRAAWESRTKHWLESCAKIAMRTKKKAANLPPKLTEVEQDLLSHIQDGYELETDSLGGNPVLRRLKDDEEIRPLSANRNTIKAMEQRGLISPGKGRDRLTIVWRLKEKQP
jgi:hypothetical protein